MECRPQRIKQQGLCHDPPGPQHAASRSEGLHLPDTDQRPFRGRVGSNKWAGAPRTPKASFLPSSTRPWKGPDGHASNLVQKVNSVSSGNAVPGLEFAGTGNITQLDKVMFGNPPRALQADRREHRRGARAQRGSCCGDAADDARPRDPARPRTSRRHRRGGKREATEAAACTAPRKSPSPTPSPRAARRQCAGSSATSSTTKRRRRPTGEGRCGPCAPWTAVPLISCSPSSRSFWVLGGLHGRLGRE